MSGLSKRQLLRQLELEAVQPVPPPMLPAVDGPANLRALADSMGPREWAQHLAQLRREGHWSLLEQWSGSRSA